MLVWLVSDSADAYNTSPYFNVNMQAIIYPFIFVQHPFRIYLERIVDVKREMLSHQI